MFHAGRAGQSIFMIGDDRTIIHTDALSGVVGSLASIQVPSGGKLGLQPSFGGTITTSVVSEGLRQNIFPAPGDPAATAPIGVTGFLQHVFRLDVSGGGFTQGLPTLPVDNGTLGNGGTVTVIEESGSPGLLVDGLGANTINGSLVAYPVPAGGTVVFLNDGDNNWVVQSVFDPGASIVSQVVYQPGGTGVGPAVFSDWTALLAQVALIKLINGNAQVELFFDDSITSPIPIPVGGPYDMERVTWTGRRATGGIGNQVLITIPEGVTFTDLRDFDGTIRVTNLATATIPDESLATGENINVRGEAHIENTGSVALWAGTSLAGGNTVIVVCHERGALGFNLSPTAPFVDIVAAATLVAGAFSFGFMRENCFDGPGGATLILNPVGDAARIRNAHSGFAGTISQFSQQQVRYIPDIALVTTTSALTEQRLARFDTTAGNVIGNLPAASTIFRGEVIVVKNEAGGNSVNVTPNGGDTIDGVAALYAVAAGLASQFVSDGVSNWTRI